MNILYLYARIDSDALSDELSLALLYLSVSKFNILISLIYKLDSTPSGAMYYYNYVDTKNKF